MWECFLLLLCKWFAPTWSKYSIPEMVFRRKYYSWHFLNLILQMKLSLKVVYLKEPSISKVTTFISAQFNPNQLGIFFHIWIHLGWARSFSSRNSIYKHPYKLLKSHAPKHMSRKAEMWKKSIQRRRFFWHLLFVKLCCGWLHWWTALLKMGVCKKKFWVWIKLAFNWLLLQ